jgi:hypothetical protein
MKAWRTLLIAGFGTLVTSACTLTVSEGSSNDGNDEDDIGLDDQQDFNADNFADDADDADDVDDADDTADPTDDTADPTDDTDDTAEPTDDAPATEDDAGVTTDDSVTDDSVTDDSVTDDSVTDDAPVDMDGGGSAPTCVLPEAADSCESCMQTDCAVAYEACACDEDCSASLDMMRGCFMDKGYSADVQPEQYSDFAECRPSVSDGSLLAEVTLCIESEAMTDNMEFDRFAGDGTCTMACMGLFSIAGWDIPADEMSGDESPEDMPELGASDAGAP